MVASQDNSRRQLPAEVRRFLDSIPCPEFFEAYVVDVNGILRGKRLPVDTLSSVYTKGLCLPASTLLMDIQGEEVEATGMVLDTGDGDYYCLPVAGSLRPRPWSQRASGQFFTHMFTPEGKPFMGDPRTLLQQTLERLARRGLTPVVATELEFRLFERGLDASGRPEPAAKASLSGKRSQLYGLAELDRLDDLFADIERACEAQGLPVDTLIAEQGEAQYEINLMHVPDTLLAADHTVLLKRTIKNCAENHGMIASFMAKPYGDSSGNGMHVHISMLDGNGHNVMAEQGEPSRLLQQCVAGLLQTMFDATAVFAPHENSYRRLQQGSYAPVYATWGMDNRTTALRVPLSDADATRIEHRVAGADANPYLVLTALLAGMDYGIEHRLDPPSQTYGNGYAHPGDAAVLPDSWGAALTAFEDSSFITEYFGKYQQWFSACKRQEREKLKSIVPSVEYDWYLSTV